MKKKLIGKRIVWLGTRTKAGRVLYEHTEDTKRAISQKALARYKLARNNAPSAMSSLRAYALIAKLEKNAQGRFLYKNTFDVKKFLLKDEKKAYEEALETVHRRAEYERISHEANNPADSRSDNDGQGKLV